MFRRNRASLYYGGRKYRSGFEALTAQDLHLRGIKYKYEEECFPYQQTATYVSDFSLPLGVLVECKGWLRPTDRRQLLEIKKQYPDADIRLLFQRARNRIDGTRKGSMTYAQWATKHGFLWAEGKVPDEWVLVPPLET